MTTLLTRPRPFAIVSGVSGLAAGLCFVVFLAFGDPAGLASDVLGWVQLIALAPVALALGDRMRAARVACAVVATAAVLTPVLEIVTSRSIWPGAVCTYLVFA